MGPSLSTLHFPVYLPSSYLPFLSFPYPFPSLPFSSQFPLPLEVRPLHTAIGPGGAMSGSSPRNFRWGSSPDYAGPA